MIRPSILTGYNQLTHTYSTLVDSAKPFKNERSAGFITVLEKPKKGVFNNAEPTQMYTMDIETMTLKDFDDLQIPIAISAASNEDSKVFVIDHVELKVAVNNRSIPHIEKLVDKMFLEYFKYLHKLNKIATIFVHNLGGFVPAGRSVHFQIHVESSR